MGVGEELRVVRVLGFVRLPPPVRRPPTPKHASWLRLGLDSADRFDPAAFDAAEANSALRALATVLVENRHVV